MSASALLTFTQGCSPAVQHCGNLPVVQVKEGCRLDAAMLCAPGCQLPGTTEKAVLQLTSVVSPSRTCCVVSLESSLEVSKVRIPLLLSHELSRKVKEMQPAPPRSLSSSLPSSHHPPLERWFGLGKYFLCNDKI